VFDNKVLKSIKEMRTVVRTGSRLRMVLNRKSWNVKRPKPLDNIIIEAHMTHLHPTESCR
jgi:hypothetical protein